LRILQAGDLHLDINGKRLGRLILFDSAICMNALICERTGDDGEQLK
jgi:hypothetical protein